MEVTVFEGFTVLEICWNQKKVVRCISELSKERKICQVFGQSQAKYWCLDLGLLVKSNKESEHDVAQAFIASEW